MDLKALERLTLIRLREEASKIPDLHGVRAMTREKLIRTIALTRKLDVSQWSRGGASKVDVKKQIREMRSKIVEAIQAKSARDIKRLRLQTKRLKARTRALVREKPVPTPAVENPTV